MIFQIEKELTRVGLIPKYSYNPIINGISLRSSNTDIVVVQWCIHESSTCCGVSELGSFTCDPKFGENEWLTLMKVTHNLWNKIVKVNRVHSYITTEAVFSRWKSLLTSLNFIKVDSFHNPRSNNTINHYVWKKANT